MRNICLFLSYLGTAYHGWQMQKDLPTVQQTMEKAIEMIVKHPVHELSMMMCIALRFIPTLIEETDKIMCAQKARGADFENGSIIDRAKALVPILVPLFISTFRRADELATAMECRCYHGDEGRTKMKLLRYKRNDFCAFGVGIALMVVICVLRRFGL